MVRSRLACCILQGFFLSLFFEQHFHTDLSRILVEDCQDWVIFIAGFITVIIFLIEKSETDITQSDNVKRDMYAEWLQYTSKFFSLCAPNTFNYIRRTRLTHTKLKRCHYIECGNQQYCERAHSTRVSPGSSGSWPGVDYPKCGRPTTRDLAALITKCNLSSFTLRLELKAMKETHTHMYFSESEADQKKKGERFVPAPFAPAERVLIC